MGRVAESLTTQFLHSDLDVEGVSRVSVPHLGYLG
jgi:hypothetical protein